MDLFEERILTVLNDGKPRFFAQLLGEVGFGRNTLKLHLKRLVAQSLVAKEKTVSNGRGRPKYTYSISSSPAASFRRPPRYVYNDCNPAVQPHKTPLQVRERRILQTNQKQM